MPGVVLRFLETFDQTDMAWTATDTGALVSELDAVLLTAKSVTATDTATLAEAVAPLGLVASDVGTLTQAWSSTASATGADDGVIADAGSLLGRIPGVDSGHLTESTGGTHRGARDRGTLVEVAASAHHLVPQAPPVLVRMGRRGSRGITRHRVGVIASRPDVTIPSRYG